MNNAKIIAEITNNHIYIKNLAWAAWKYMSAGHGEVSSEIAWAIQNKNEIVALYSKHVAKIQQQQ